jgi:hypothetical protein
MSNVINSASLEEPVFVRPSIPRAYLEDGGEMADRQGPFLGALRHSETSSHERRSEKGDKPKLANHGPTPPRLKMADHRWARATTPPCSRC